MSARIPQLVTLGLLAALLEVCFLALRRLHPLDENVGEAVAVSLAAGVIYLAAGFLALSWNRTSRAALLAVLFAAVIFRLTLFSLPPSLSSDFYRYRWEGEIQLQGHNPYLSTPADLRPAELERFPGPQVSTAYAPLTQLLFRLAAWWDGAAAFKLLSVGFDLGTLFLLVALLRQRGQPAVRALLYAWCPLVVLEFAGSGHNDSLALFGLVLALYSIIRWPPAVSILALALATMTKWFPAVTLPVFLRRARWWGLPLFAGATFLLTLPYLDAGWSLLKGFRTYAEQWRNNSSLYDLLWHATGREAVATGAALVAVGGLALYLGWRRADPVRASYLLLTAVLLFSPSVFPWYVTWIVPLLCFYPNPGLLLFTSSVLLSYHVLIDFRALGVWHYTPWLVWLEYTPVYALLVWNGLRKPRAGPARAVPTC